MDGAEYWFPGSENRPLLPCTSIPKGSYHNNRSQVDVTMMRVTRSGTKTAVSRRISNVYTKNKKKLKKKYSYEKQ